MPARPTAGPTPAPPRNTRPADLHKAKTALDKAEQSFIADTDTQTTIDLAYIAERTAQIAEARAQTAIAEKSGDKAKQELGDTQGQIAKKTEGDLVKTRAQLSEAERGQAQQAEKVGVERAAREEADQQGRSVGAVGQGSERRPRQAGGQGGRARHGHHPLGQRPVSLERRDAVAGGPGAPESGRGCAGRQEAGRGRRGSHGFARARSPPT